MLYVIVICAIIAIIALMVVVSVQESIDEKIEINEGIVATYGNFDGYVIVEDAREQLHKLYFMEEFGIYPVVIFLSIAIILFIFYLYVNKMQIIVTDKRVYGKTSYGKQVDLPLDSISSVGISILKGIAVGSSSGKIKFLGISNRDEIYEEIKMILADRQLKEVRTNSSVANITQVQSSADELKKFKELFDCGVITQEEFDTKKKQLLGL